MALARPACAIPTSSKAVLIECFVATKLVVIDLDLVSMTVISHLFARIEKAVRKFSQSGSLALLPFSMAADFPFLQMLRQFAGENNGPRCNFFCA
ncbi:MAG: hypothetical protein ACYDDO_04560 [Acidiferrobacterales bacterium]